MRSRPASQPRDYCGPTTPDSPCESSGLGSSAFARRYLRNHCCFLFLRVLRWFTSPGLPGYPMDSDNRTLRPRRVGSPIRKSPDHRLLASPRGLSQLATSFFAYSRQGIHTHALSSLTIKFTLRSHLAALAHFRVNRHVLLTLSFWPPSISLTAAGKTLC